MGIKSFFNGLFGHADNQMPSSLGNGVSKEQNTINLGGNIQHPEQNETSSPKDEQDPAKDDEKGKRGDALSAEAPGVPACSRGGSIGTFPPRRPGRTRTDPDPAPAPPPRQNKENAEAGVFSERKDVYNKPCLRNHSWETDQRRMNRMKKCWLWFWP
jgi:hypothetical protein